MSSATQQFGQACANCAAIVIAIAAIAIAAVILWVLFI